MSVAVGGDDGISHAAHDGFELLALSGDRLDRLLEAVRHRVKRLPQSLQLVGLIYWRATREVTRRDSFGGVTEIVEGAGDASRQARPHKERRAQTQEARSGEGGGHPPELPPDPSLRRGD